MCAPSVIRFRVQKCIHCLARDPRSGLFFSVFELGRRGKQHKFAAEITRFNKRIVYCEVHVKFRLVDSIAFSFSKDFLGGHFKKNELFVFFCSGRLYYPQGFEMMFPLQTDFRG